MKGYKVVKKGKKWTVQELQTALCLKVCDTKSEADKFARHLSLGGGFSGRTPQFMVDRTVLR